MFAEEQARYVTEALTPIDAVLIAMGAEPLDIDRIGQQYAQAIRQRAADGTPTDLHGIIEKGTE